MTALALFAFFIALAAAGLKIVTRQMDQSYEIVPLREDILEDNLPFLAIGIGGIGLAFSIQIFLIVGMVLGFLSAIPGLRYRKDLRAVNKVKGTEKEAAEAQKLKEEEAAKAQEEEERFKNSPLGKLDDATRQSVLDEVEAAARKSIEVNDSDGLEELEALLNEGSSQSTTPKQAPEEETS